MRKQSQVFYLQFNQPVPDGFLTTGVSFAYSDYMWALYLQYLDFPTFAEFTDGIYR